MVYLICVSAFLVGKQREMLCNKVNIKIADSTERRFLTSGDINNLILKSNFKVLGEPIRKINTDTIEKIVLANTLVKSCRVFTTIDGTLNIEVRQRNPVVRIIDRYGQSYYLDSEGSNLGISHRYSPHLLVVNGYIETPFSIRKVENIYSKQYNGKAKRLREIHEMAMFIMNDKFWNAQIEQIYVNNKGEYELIPRIGAHVILLGKADDYREKLDKLWIFYSEGLNKVGWNNYLKINLKYKDQIVCTKI